MLIRPKSAPMAIAHSDTTLGSQSEYRCESAHSPSHPHNHRQVRGLDTPYGRENGAPLSKRILSIRSLTTDNSDLINSLWACPLRGMAVVNQIRLRQVLALRASILKPLAHRGPARSACFRGLRRLPVTSLFPCNVSSVIGQKARYRLIKSHACSAHRAHALSYLMPTRFLAVHPMNRDMIALYDSDST